MPKTQPFRRMVTVQPASHSPPLCGCPLHTQLPAVTYGRAPYVKSQNHLLTCKHDASASMICRMAELLRRMTSSERLVLEIER